MDYSVEQDDKAVVVTLDGEVDLQHSPTLRRVLLKAVENDLPVLVNLEKVAYIDSSGIASLVEALQTARGRGIDLVLVSVSDAVARVLKLARLDKVFKIAADRAAALG